MGGSGIRLGAEGLSISPIIPETFYFQKDYLITRQRMV